MTREEATAIAMDRVATTGLPWVTEEHNAGWTFDLIGNKKIRMKTSEYDKRIELQGQIIEEVLAEMEVEEVEAEEMETEEAETKGYDFTGALSQEVPAVEEGKGTLETTMVTLDEVGSTKQLAHHVLIEATKGKTPKMIIIECSTCKESRIIKVQDAFQVSRCKDCQKTHRNAKRRARNKQKKEQTEG